MVSAAIWAVVATLPFFFAFWGTYERHSTKPEVEMGFVEGFVTTFKNKAFRYAVWIYLLSWLVVQTVSVIIVYYVNYWLRNPSYTPLVILSVQGSALLWLSLWNVMSRRWGKKGVYYVGMSFWIVMALALFMLPQTASLPLVMAVGIFTGAGVAAAFLIPWSLLPDVIELDELETGQRREGAFYGFFVLLQKLGVALGVFLVGQVLQYSGYVSPAANADPLTVTQPASALTAIRWMIGPIPALILLAGMVMVYLFPITKEQHAATLAELARRREAQQGHSA